MNESPYSIVFRTPALLVIFGILIVFEVLWCKYYLKRDYGTGEAFASIGIAVGRAAAKALMGVMMVRSGRKCASHCSRFCGKSHNYL